MRSKMLRIRLRSENNKMTAEQQDRLIEGEKINET